MFCLLEGVQYTSTPLDYKYPHPPIIRYNRYIYMNSFWPNNKPTYLSFGGPFLYCCLTSMIQHVSGFVLKACIDVLPTCVNNIAVRVQNPVSSIYAGWWKKGFPVHGLWYSPTKSSTNRGFDNCSTDPWKQHNSSWPGRIKLLPSGKLMNIVFHRFLYVFPFFPKSSI